MENYLQIILGKKAHSRFRLQMIAHHASGLWGAGRLRHRKVLLPFFTAIIVSKDTNRFLYPC